MRSLHSNKLIMHKYKTLIIIYVRRLLESHSKTAIQTTLNNEVYALYFVKYDWKLEKKLNKKSLQIGEMNRIDEHSNLKMLSAITFICDKHTELA